MTSMIAKWMPAMELGVLKILTLALLCAGPLTAPLVAQPEEGDDLETRLSNATGQDRVEIISEGLEKLAYEDPGRAIELAREALSLLDENAPPEQILAIRCELCRAHMRKHEVEEALSVGERCVEDAEALDDLSWLAHGHLWCLSRSYARGAQLGLSVVHGTRAAELYEESGDELGLAEALNWTSVELGDIGDMTTSIEYLHRALEIYREAGSIRGEALALLRLGGAHASLEQMDQSIEYAAQSLEAFRAIGSLPGEGAALNNLAIGHSSRHEFERALELFEQSLEIKKRLGDQRSVALALLNIGSARAEIDGPAAGLPIVLQAVDTFEELGQSREEALSRIELSRLYQEVGQLDRALENIQQAIALATEIDFEETVGSAHEQLAKIEEERGDFRAALAAQRKYDEIKSRLLSSSNSRRIAEMAARFQAEQKAQEIEDLKEERAVQDLEMRHQRRLRTGLIVAFVLLLSVLALLFNRYRLQAHAARMKQAVDNEKKVSASLREVDRLKDVFLANTSHELRTPLFGIVGLAESLLDGVAGELPAAARRNLDLILKSGRRLSHLVADILDSAKLRHGEVQLAKGPIDLHSVADIVVTLSRPLLADKPVELVNAVPDDLPPALADADRLEQVLHNLVGNAIKFTERGRISVEAELISPTDDDSQSHLLIRIQDTGMGIAEEKQGRIFESFQQADESIEREHGGTGLGLAISRQLVRLHGGDLAVRSTLGEGSTFYFALDIAQDSADDGRSLPAISVATETPMPTVVTAASDAPADDAMVILAIDDEPINRQVLANHLAPQGHRVLSASSGTEALELLSREAVDLVLLDIMMPRMSGYEVCRRIREDRGRDELPVIFLSAKNQASDRIAGFEEGGNDYLAKPIAKLELLKRVETQLELLQTHRVQAEEIKVLRGLLTICSHCKKIRDEDGDWDMLETYIDNHSEASFSHGLCPTCLSIHYEELGVPHHT